MRSHHHVDCVVKPPRAPFFDSASNTWKYESTAARESLKCGRVVGAAFATTLVGDHAVPNAEAGTKSANAYACVRAVESVAFVKPISERRPHASTELPKAAKFASAKK